MAVEVVDPGEARRAGGGRRRRAGWPARRAAAGRARRRAEVVGSYDLPGARLLDVVAVMDRLRSPGGCPWDAAADPRARCGRTCSRRPTRPTRRSRTTTRWRCARSSATCCCRSPSTPGWPRRPTRPWSVDDVAGDLVDKLVRRHPHVFAGGSADDLEGTWEALKAAEKGRTSVTEGVPLGSPRCRWPRSCRSAGRRLGAPVPAYDGPGGELWELVRRCREQGVDPEAELRDGGPALPRRARRRRAVGPRRGRSTRPRSTRRGGRPRWS